jgi:tRNA threonylcarbamoyladenosine biosynthesis protein TsaE
MKNTTLLRGARNTKIFAARFADRILRTTKKRRSACVIGLIGNLGAGKTTFTQGFARALGVRQRMISPTFLLMRSYSLSRKRGTGVARNGAFERLHHIDLYRIHSTKELKGLDFKKIINDPRNIVLIEWADNAKKFLPRNAYRLRFFYGTHPHERKVAVHPRA